eukprot:scaffold10_cov257-Pinguiococcus_pyrenoidosus.AAC.46
MPKLKQPRRNPAYAFYDANGVLWLGHTKRDRAGELKQIVDLDSTFRLPSGDAPGQESEGKKGEETKEEGKGGEAEKEQSEETPEVKTSTLHSPLRSQLLLTADFYRRRRTT